MKKHKVRLNVKELLKIAIDHDIRNDAELASMLGVSPTQIWRLKQEVTHSNYCAPSNEFIAATLHNFKVPFDRVFFLDTESRPRNFSYEEELKNRA